ncbi:MAG: hypothetical protein AAB325_07505 [Pseudomonadota bacterium]
MEKRKNSLNERQSKKKLSAELKPVCFLQHNGLRNLIYLVALFLLTGCASVGIKDNLPPGSPKGYVEFYISGYQVSPSGYQVSEGSVSVIRSGSSESFPNIYMIQNGRKINALPWPWFKFSSNAWEYRYYFWSSQRISRAPGEYDFVIEYGNASERIRVKIKEDMLTLVVISLEQTGAEWWGVMYFRMKITTGGPIPVKLELETIRHMLSIPLFLPIP